MIDDDDQQRRSAVERAIVSALVAAVVRELERADVTDEEHTRQPDQVRSSDRSPLPRCCTDERR